MQETLEAQTSPREYATSGDAADSAFSRLLLVVAAFDVSPVVDAPRALLIGREIAAHHCHCAVFTHVAGELDALIDGALLHRKLGAGIDPNARQLVGEDLAAFHPSFSAL